MALTRGYHETVIDRIRQEPAFADALYTEAIAAFEEDDLDSAFSILRDLFQATGPSDNASAKRRHKQPARERGTKQGFQSMDLLEEFNALVTRLQEEKIKFALCGGLAMAVYAFPRATMDIDLMIEPSSLDDVRRIGHELGFTLDTGLMKFQDGAIQMHRLTKASPQSEFELMLDLLLVTPEIEDVWAARQEVTWAQGTLPVISPTGLIRLKSLRGSGQDQDDIAHLRRLTDES